MVASIDSLILLLMICFRSYAVKSAVLYTSLRILIKSDIYGVFVIALMESNDVDLKPFIAFRRIADSILIRLVYDCLLIFGAQISDA